jgi:transcription antitermination factor NusG
LIPSFVFVHIEEHQKLEVLQTKSVINFLYWLKKPAIIKDKDIDILKRFLNDHAHCELIEEHLFDGDAVEITSGAFIGMKGTLDTLQGKVAHIQLPLLNRVYKFKIPSASIIKAL